MTASYWLCSYNPDQTFYTAFTLMKGRSEGKGWLIEGVGDLHFLELHTKILLNGSADVLLLIAIIKVPTYSVYRSTLKISHRESWLSSFCRWKNAIWVNKAQILLYSGPPCTYQQNLQCTIAAPELCYR